MSGPVFDVALVAAGMFIGWLWRGEREIQAFRKLLDDFDITRKKDSTRLEPPR